MHTRRTEFVKTIALIAQKGGVGKTTMGVSLAVASGLRTAIFDLDPKRVPPSGPIAAKAICLTWSS